VAGCKSNGAPNTAGQPAHLAEQFAGLLWGTLMVSLLLGVAERPANVS